MTDEIPQLYLDAAPGARSNLPDEIVARALWRYADFPEWTVDRIAAEACIHPRMVARWATKAGTPRRRNGQRAYPSGSLAESVDAYLSTGSLSEAARQLGISAGAVRRRIMLAGITPEDRSTAISARLRLVNDTQDGCLSTTQAAQMIGVTRSTIIRWLNAGQVPGARLTVRGDGSGRPAWRIPPGFVHQRRPDTDERGYDELLPADPLRDWLRAMPDEVRAIARRSSVSERRISGIRSGLQAWVSFETADRVLTAHGAQLDALWPDLDERLANPTTPRSFMGAAA